MPSAVKGSHATRQPQAEEFEGVLSWSQEANLGQRHSACSKLSRNNLCVHMQAVGTPSCYVQPLSSRCHTPACSKLSPQQPLSSRVCRPWVPSCLLKVTPEFPVCSTSDRPDLSSYAPGRGRPVCSKLSGAATSEFTCVRAGRSMLLRFRNL